MNETKSGQDEFQSHSQAREAAVSFIRGDDFDPTELQARCNTSLLQSLEVDDPL